MRRSGGLAERRAAAGKSRRGKRGTPEVP